MDPQWLKWAKQIQAISQSGLAYVKDIYDKERYEMLRELAVEIMEQHSDADKEQIRAAFASDTGYATPKTDIRAVVMKEGKLLLVRERTDGGWSLPGGWADVGYSPFQVAVKETREESGYEVKAERLLAVLDKQFHGHPPSPWHCYKIFIACSLVGGEAAGGQGTLETSEVGFFSPGKLPPLSLERNTEEQVLTMVKLYGEPHAQALCD
ncbi:MAG: ADP-ribose pyrophosphatase [Paenibacillaceae bacterium]|jgi:ADP-ribose pyrophosphatase YjhB (NUDIX family)|nr:ADP-ribose pyrophosphatase [Paenibacillaceae bacterium]